MTKNDNVLKIKRAMDSLFFYALYCDCVRVCAFVVMANDKLHSVFVLIVAEHFFT